MTAENNMMLKSIIKYLSDQRNNADGENFNDFIRNIMATMIRVIKVKQAAHRIKKARVTMGNKKVSRMAIMIGKALRL